MSETIEVNEPETFQTVTQDSRPRRLGPTEHLVRCSCCEEPTIVVAEGDPGAGVLCEGCLYAAQN
jgi:formylmethanofuran dehydrogenase subunit E